MNNWKTIDLDDPETWPKPGEEFVYLYVHSPKIKRIEQRQWAGYNPGWHGTQWRKVLPTDRPPE